MKEVLKKILKVIVAVLVIIWVWNEFFKTKKEDSNN